MPGDGFGREPQFREVLKAIDDPDESNLVRADGEAAARA